MVSSASEDPNGRLPPTFQTFAVEVRLSKSRHSFSREMRHWIMSHSAILLGHQVALRSDLIIRGEPRTQSRHCAGEPGYREGMDGDDDGIACEPYPGP